MLNFQEKVKKLLDKVKTGDWSESIHDTIVGSGVASNYGHGFENIASESEWEDLLTKYDKMMSQGMAVFSVFADDGWDLPTSKVEFEFLYLHDLIGKILDLLYNHYFFIRIEGLGDVLEINGEEDEDFVSIIEDKWQYISGTQAAELVGVDSSVIRRHMINKNIKGKKIGRNWLVDLDDLLKYYS